MATLVLSTVGTALGGPVGGAIGSLIGYTIDQQLLGPGPRRGPRLGELAVQSSSYGTQIPRIYGTMRVAGSVIWATDLKESSGARPGAKGQPASIVYSYSVSLAVALSCRSVQRIKRIWADGRLLRGGAGDFKVKTGFRFYPGSENQDVDPLIASCEGQSRTPAYRGTALAVFEDLELAEFGNRIPFLTFEVEADAVAPAVGLVLADASDGVIQVDAPEQIGGYAAYGASTNAALRPLIEHFGVDLCDTGGLLASASSSGGIISETELGCSADPGRTASSERSRAPARELPITLTIAYYDASRDYQTGQVRATAAGGGVHETVELPITAEAGSAKALAETSIARRWSRRESLVVHLPPTRLDLQPGATVQLQGAAGVWQVEKVTIERLAVIVQLRPVAAASAALPADGGRAILAPDKIAGPTRLVLLDLPDLGFSRHDLPILHVAAGASPGPWRPVPLEIQVGSEIRSSQAAPAESVLGWARSVLPSGQAALIDLGGSVEIELADPDHWLESRTDDDLLNGANLAALGNELIQFGSAVPLGSGRFSLRRLLRGRRGTEWAMHSHLSGEPFVILNPDALQPIEVPQEFGGMQVRVTALGTGDGPGTLASAVAGGEGMRPPSPVHLTAARALDGGLHLRWVRRSRSGWVWRGEVEVPIGESSERYRLRIESGSGSGSVELQTTVPEANVPALQLAALGSGPATVSVFQMGDFAQSRPATLAVNLD